MIRDAIKAAQIAAMKAGDKETRQAVGLIQAALKNRDIEARAPQSREGKAPADDDALVVEVLQKMVKQRRESIDMYRRGGREEQERARHDQRARGHAGGGRTLAPRALGPPPMGEQGRPSRSRGGCRLRRVQTRCG